MHLQIKPLSPLVYCQALNVEAFIAGLRLALTLSAHGTPTNAQGYYTTWHVHRFLTAGVWYVHLHQGSTGPPKIMEVAHGWP